MTTTRATFEPQSAAYPASNFPQFLKLAAGGTDLRDALGFDATTSESCFWTFVAPQGITAPLTAVVTFSAATATTGTFQPDVSLEAVSSGDSLDLDSASSFDTANAGAATTVAATAGFPLSISVTVTNNDSIVAGDLCRLKLARNISDTAAGDIYVYSVELRDAA